MPTSSKTSSFVEWTSGKIPRYTATFINEPHAKKIFINTVFPRIQYFKLSGFHHPSHCYLDPTKMHFLWIGINFGRNISERTFKVQFLQISSCCSLLPGDFAFCDFSQGYHSYSMSYIDTRNFTGETQLQATSKYLACFSEPGSCWTSPEWHLSTETNCTWYQEGSCLCSHYSSQ